MRHLSKAFLFSIAFGTHKRLCRIQGYIFKPTGSTLSRLLSPFFEDSKKLVGAVTPFVLSLNILVVVFAGLRAPLRVYLNEKVKNIIQEIIEARFTATKSPYKYYFKARFPDIYRSNNYMAYYNFCQ